MQVVINCILCHCGVRPSMLWRCWLGGRKGIRPVKTEWWGAGMVICLEWGADLHMAQLMPLPLIVPCFSKIQIDFTFLVPAHPGSPGKRAVKRVCVCVCVESDLQLMSPNFFYLITLALASVLWHWPQSHYFGLKLALDKTFLYQCWGFCLSLGLEHLALFNMTAKYSSLRSFICSCAAKY